MCERHLMLIHINPFKASKFIVLSQLQPKHRRSQTDPTYYSSQCGELQSHLDLCRDLPVATPVPLFESVSAELFASKPTTDVAHLDSSTNRCLSAKCLTCCHIKNANSFSAATIISIISRKCHVCWSGSSHTLAHDLHRMLYVNCHQSAAQVPRTRASTAWRLWSHRAWPKLLKDSTKKGTDQQQQHIDQPSWNMKGCERRRNLVEILLPEK